MSMIPKKIVFWVLGKGIGMIPIYNTQKKFGISLVYEYGYGYDTQNLCIGY